MTPRWQGKLEKLDENRFLIRKETVPGMLVDGIIYSDDRLKQHLLNDNTPLQVSNVAFLPGIQKYSLAMPDIHWGYGFPIGGVAAIDPESGVVSPGGVGYDINCGVRMLTTNIFYSEIKKYLSKLLTQLFEKIPCGLGRGGLIRLNKKSLKDVCRNGSYWAVQNGFGWDEDIDFTEENGRLGGAEPERISDYAFKRGSGQLGSLGSGNHFLEIQKVQKIFDTEKAKYFNLEEGMITIMIHSGSRGFGHQVCSDSLKFMRNAPEKYGFKIPDKQLACAPINSEEGKAYLAEMNSAANYAWANRQVMTHFVREIFAKVLKKKSNELGLQLIYDVAHNIAKFEEFEIDGIKKKLLVHRKGATRAFGPGNKNIPAKYKPIGQPVLIPGDMGTASYLMVGTEKAELETFGSTAHGAGRMLSRAAAVRQTKDRSIREELSAKGIIVRYRGKKTLREEMPDAYKDIDLIAEIVDSAGLSKKIARLVPLAVIKG